MIIDYVIKGHKISFTKINKFKIMLKLSLINFEIKTSIISSQTVWKNGKFYNSTSILGRKKEGKKKKKKLCIMLDWIHYLLVLNLQMARN